MFSFVHKLFVHLESFKVDKLDTYIRTRIHTLTHTHTDTHEHAHAHARAHLRNTRNVRREYTGVSSHRRNLWLFIREGKVIGREVNFRCRDARRVSLIRRSNFFSYSAHVASTASGVSKISRKYFARTRRDNKRPKTNERPKQIRFDRCKRSRRCFDARWIAYGLYIR